MGNLIDALEDRTIPTKGVSDAFDRIYFSQLLRSMVRQKPELAHFDGELHERHVADFRELDNERLALAKYRALTAHFKRLPPHSAVGAAGIVRSEMERKRGHRSVRRLLRDAGSVVQAIKPVFMMSPLSVSQFLEPGAVEFDLLVIDEASQVQPVDALGAIARCKQIVVVGDSKQLPPTKFFARLTSDVEGEEEDADEPQAAQAADIESILGLCRARGLPEKMLRWHYRSRHHSLIAVSNHEFYDDRLFIVPSPFLSNPELGLKFHFVEGGVFDSGASATNRIEARAVCRAIVDHAKNSPSLSLGVASFSVKQQKAILDELELARRQDPAIEEFFLNHSTEPFFCKNLENVQGDERDVIFISVGYGKNSSGYMARRCLGLRLASPRWGLAMRLTLPHKFFQH
jgi:superfamily I DNA and/or RNA helicase